MTIGKQPSATSAATETDRLFQKHSVAELRQLYLKVRNDSNAKRQELRDLVGAHYRDFLPNSEEKSAASSIITIMPSKVSELRESISSIEDGLRKIGAEMRDPGKVKSPLSPIDPQDPSAKEAFQVACQVKLLIDSYEQIHFHLDNSAVLSASLLFLLAREIQKNLSANEEFKGIIRTKWNDDILPLKTKITELCFESLRSKSDDVLDSVLCLMMLDSYDEESIFTKVFLKERYNALSRDDISVKERLSLLLGTLEQGYRLFVGHNGSSGVLSQYIHDHLDPGINLHPSVSSSALANDLFNVSKTKMHLMYRYLPPNVRVLKPRISFLLSKNREFFKTEFQSWLKTVVSQFNSISLKEVKTGQELVLLKREIEAILGKSEILSKFFENINVWDKLFETSFNSKSIEIIEMTMKSALSGAQEFLSDGTKQRIDFKGQFESVVSLLKDNPKLESHYMDSCISLFTEILQFCSKTILSLSENNHDINALTILGKKTKSLFLSRNGSIIQEATAATGLSEVSHAFDSAVNEALEAFVGAFKPLVKKLTETYSDTLKDTYAHDADHWNVLQFSLTKQLNKPSKMTSSNWDVVEIENERYILPSHPSPTLIRILFRLVTDLKHHTEVLEFEKVFEYFGFQISQETIKFFRNVFDSAFSVEDKKHHLYQSYFDLLFLGKILKPSFVYRLNKTDEKRDLNSSFVDVKNKAQIVLSSISEFETVKDTFSERIDRCQTRYSSLFQAFNVGSNYTPHEGSSVRSFLSEQHVIVPIIQSGSRFALFPVSYQPLERTSLDELVESILENSENIGAVHIESKPTQKQLKEPTNRPSLTKELSSISSSIQNRLFGNVWG